MDKIDELKNKIVGLNIFDAINILKNDGTYSNIGIVEAGKQPERQFEAILILKSGTAIVENFIKDE